MQTIPRVWLAIISVCSLCILACVSHPQIDAEDQGAIALTTREPTDPAAWGTDHVGRPFPDYVTGDECLFCHREIGPTWPENRHQLTVRPAIRHQHSVKSLNLLPGGDRIQNEIELEMGHSRVTRFAKRSKAYGKLDLLTAKYFHASKDDDPNDRGKIVGTGNVHWDAQTFGDRCAGCHATAVDSKTRAFSAISLDCFTCHGSVDLAHTKDSSLVLLSNTNQDARQVISICGQCHLRGGTSKSTGLPYPNTFVAGDNLFRDFNVDLSLAAIAKLPPRERHIFENVRTVVMLGQNELTCISCHNVHDQSTDSHQQLEESSSCTVCHVPNSGNSELNDAFLKSKHVKLHSTVCDY